MVEHRVTIEHTWKGESGIQVTLQADPQWDEINIELRLTDKRHAPIRLKREELTELSELLQIVKETLKK